MNTFLAASTSSRIPTRSRSTAGSASRPTTLLRPGPAGRPAASGRARIAPAQLKIADSPAASVLRAVILGGPSARDTITGQTGASAATVNRQVSSLLAAGLLNERADLTIAGSVGRPRIPVEVDHDAHVALGIHIGAAGTAIVAVDPSGRISGVVEVPTPKGDPSAALASIADSAAAYAARRRGPRLIWVGVAIGGAVDAATGVVDHPRLGWTGAQVGRLIGERFDVPISVAPHVPAMAAAELLLTRATDTPVLPDGGTSLYVYARETVGLALTVNNRVHAPASGAGSIAHLPTGSSVACSCGAVGCLEVTVGDRTIVEAARAAGVPEVNTIANVISAAREGSAAAHDLLVERGRVLGRAVAVARDMINPDRVILGGQAFTDYRPALAAVAAEFAARTTLAPITVHVTGFGSRVQHYAAAAVALGSLYADPLGTLRRAATLPRTA